MLKHLHRAIPRLQVLETHLTPKEAFRVADRKSLLRTGPQLRPKSLKPAFNNCSQLSYNAHDRRRYSADSTPEAL